MYLCVVFYVAQCISVIMSRLIQYNYIIYVVLQVASYMYNMSLKKWCNV